MQSVAFHAAMSIAAFCVLPVAPASAEGTLPLPSNLIALNSDEGEKLLQGSTYRRNFMTLMMNFETQQNLGYCGPATSAMVANSLGIKRPSSPDHGSFRVFTQANVFNDVAKAIKPAQEVAQSGLALNQFSRFVASQGCIAKATYASDTTASTFRTIAKGVLSNTGTVLIVNYLRKELRQMSGGHISPIAAYNEAADRFLILDVSRYKYPPVWVKTEDLWRAMAVIDPESHKSRGFVVVSKVQ
jgi:hypothetical protein